MSIAKTPLGPPETTDSTEPVEKSDKTDFCESGDSMDDTCTSKSECVAIDSISPSPENNEIYGTISPKSEEIRELAQDIDRNGLRERLIISADNFIISGHRRYAAYKLLEFEAIEVERSIEARGDYSARAWTQLLIAHNKQRVKTGAMRWREVLATMDPELAHQELLETREKRKQASPPAIALRPARKRKQISPGKQQMLRAVIDVINEFKDYWPLTVRQVHYQLLNDPPLRHSAKPDSIYENNEKSYKNLTDLLVRARLQGIISNDAIDDETRPVEIAECFDDSSEFIARDLRWLLNGYRRNLQQSQPDHVEILAEKMTLKGILSPIAEKYCIPLTIGRGFCSLSPRIGLAQRFRYSGKDRLVVLMLSDLDPEGDSIAETFAASLRDDFGLEPHCIKALLTMDQVSDWQLPPNQMEAKKTSSRYKQYWARYGTDQVYELEAISPERMQAVLRESIESVMDIDAFNREIENEKRDAAKLMSLKREIADYVRNLELDDE